MTRNLRALSNKALLVQWEQYLDKSHDEVASSTRDSSILLNFTKKYLEKLLELPDPSYTFLRSSPKC